MKWISRHSRVRRALQDRSEIASRGQFAAASVVASALVAGAAAIVSSDLDFGALFGVTVLAGIAGPLLMWLALFCYRMVRPLPRFRVDIGELSGDTGREECFGIEMLPGAGRLAVGNLEMKAVAQDGTTYGWAGVPHRTFVSSRPIYLSNCPQDWNLQDGVYDLSWRGTTWGNPPQVIAQGRFALRDGTWRRE